MGAAATVTLGLMIADRIGPDAPARASPAGGGSPRSAARPPGGKVSIAVLPLENLSGDSKQEYFADGMTDALILDLAQIGGLRVISRTSSMAYKGQRKSLPEVARELDVDWIVEGSVARAGDRVRVTAQLIDARRDEHLWARSYDHTLRDVLALQGEVASAIAREVKGALTPSQESRLSGRKPVDPDVYDLYLRGRQAWNQRTPQGFEDALGFFGRAIRRDPSFALAHAGLADTYGLLGAGGSNDATAKAKASAARAIELDGGLAEAHTSLAAVRHRADGDREAAERGFRRALELHPGYATAHQWYAILLAEAGRDAEAARHGQQAVLLDPLSGTMHMTLGLVHYYGRRYEQAAAEERKALELSPQLPLARQLLARSLIAAGQPKAAIAVCEQAKAPLSADLLATLGVAQLRAGNRGRADALLGELLGRKPLQSGALARAYAATGDATAALDMLEQTFAGGPSSYQPLLSDPIFDGLRTHPRFAELVRRARRS